MLGYTPKKRIQLNQLLTNLRDTVATLPKHDELLTQIDTAIKQLTLFQPVEHHNHQLLNQLAANQILTGGKLNALYRYHQYLQTSSAQIPNWYEPARKRAVLQILSRLDQNLTEHQTQAQYNDSSINDLVKTNLRDMGIILQLGTGGEHLTIKESVMEYIKKYLSQLCNDASQHEALSLQENFLLTLLNNKLLNDEIAFARLGKLQALRLKNDHDLLEQAKQWLRHIEQNLTTSPSHLSPIKQARLIVESSLYQKEAKQYQNKDSDHESFELIRSFSC